MNQTDHQFVQLELPSKQLQKDSKLEFKKEAIIHTQFQASQDINSNSYSTAMINFSQQQQCTSDTTPCSFTLTGIKQTRLEDSNGQQSQQPTILVYFILRQLACQGRSGKSGVLLYGWRSQKLSSHSTTNPQEFIKQIIQNSPPGSIFVFFDSLQKQYFEELVGDGLHYTVHFQISDWLDNYSGLTNYYQQLNQLIKATSTSQTAIIEDWSLNSSTKQELENYMDLAISTLWDLFTNQVLSYSKTLVPLLPHFRIDQIISNKRETLAALLINQHLKQKGKWHTKTDTGLSVTNWGNTCQSLGGIHGGIASGKQIRHWDLRAMSSNIMLQFCSRDLNWLGVVDQLLKQREAIQSYQCQATRDKDPCAMCQYKLQQLAMKNLLNAFNLLIRDSRNQFYDPTAAFQVDRAARIINNSATAYFAQNNSTHLIQFDTDGFWVCCESGKQVQDLTLELNQFVYSSLLKEYDKSTLTPYRIDFAEDGPYDMMIIPKKVLTTPGNKKPQQNNEVTGEEGKEERGLNKKYCVSKGGRLEVIKGLHQIDFCILKTEWTHKLLELIIDRDGQCNPNEVLNLWNSLVQEVKQNPDPKLLRKLCNSGAKQVCTSNPIAINYLKSLGLSLDTKTYMVQLRVLKKKSESISSRLIPVDMFIDGFGTNSQASGQVGKEAAEQGIKELNQAYKTNMKSFEDLSGMIDWDSILKKIRDEWFQWVGKF